MRVNSRTMFAVVAAIVVAVGTVFVLAGSGAWSSAEPPPAPEPPTVTVTVPGEQVLPPCTASDVEGEVAVGDQASMFVHYSSAPVGEASSHCPPPLTARLLLPTDDEPVTAALPSGEPMPPLCGNDVQVSPWTFGGY